MFFVNQLAQLGLSAETTPAAVRPGECYFVNRAQLAAHIEAMPGAWAVKVWNNLPGVIRINTAKFRNRATAIDRIWNKVAELYPDGILAEDMPKTKQRGGYARTKAKIKTQKSAKSPATRTASATGKRKLANKARTVAAANGGRKSAWATELTDALRKRFNPGQEFTLADVYKLIPSFQRRHKQNNHVAARLRTTLAQDLRGQGIVKAAKGKQRGRYLMA